jgi:DNA (cytosine-5)-methyltransferase 1
MNNNLVLSIFPGIDLLGRAFEEAGFCVVRGPDLLWGGDVRRFHPPSGVFWGIIGGPPCQDFSGLRRTEPTGNGLAMLDEYKRVVSAARPEWFLMENVARVPDIKIDGYAMQRLDINEGWYGVSTRLRHIQFGSLSGRLLNVPRKSITATEPAALASDSRDFREVCRLQGLPDDFNLPGFLATEKVKAVGNGVPLNMGRALAQAVLEVYNQPAIVQLSLAGELVKPGVCACGCGRPVTGKQRYAADEMGDTSTCRKRAQRKRERGSVTHRGVTFAPVGSQP